MTDSLFNKMQAKVDALCVDLHNIVRGQQDGNFDYQTLEKIRPKIEKKKRNGKLRRYETIYITIPIMQSPDSQYKYHIDIPFHYGRGVPIDVRLKRPRNETAGTKYANGTCKNCGKKIIRGITAKGKKMPISAEFENGKFYPIAHRDDCKYVNEFKI